MEHPYLDDVTRVVVEILDHLVERDGHASEAIARSFRYHRQLTASERATTARAVYSVLRSQRLLDFALSSVGGPRVPGFELADQAGRSPHATPRSLARRLARGILDGQTRFSTARELLPDINWRALPSAADSAKQIADETERLAVTESLPEWLAARLIRQLGMEDAKSLSASLNQPAPLTIRANRSLMDRDQLAARFRDKGCTVRNTQAAIDGLILEGDIDLFRLPEFHDGLFEVQDEGSQLISELVSPPPAGWIIDACAGAGGKTMHLGALLQGKGRIAAVGVGASAARQLEELRRRADRAKLHNVQVFLVDEELPVEAISSDDDGASTTWTLSPSALPSDGAGSEPESDEDPRSGDPVVNGSTRERVTEPVSEDAKVTSWPASLPKWLGKADRVLVDAPCSGLGVLRRNPEARYRLGEDAIARLAHLQGSILDRFAPFVKPGGRLIYATCSILVEENDDVVGAFLERHPEFVLMTVKEILGRERAERIGDGRVLRVDPRHHDADGFFAAVLRRLPAP